jgi:hypothetical protein
MPLITREPITALAHCAQQTLDGELSFDRDGVPSGEERCAGYAQVEVPAILETIAWTFGEFNGGSSDPMDVALAQNVSHSTERVVWANLDDRPCPYCKMDRELTTQVRPRYAPLGGPRGNPDQLFSDRKARRLQGETAAKSADAAERQAVALERANQLEERRIAAMEEANRISALALEQRDPSPPAAPQRRKKVEA